MRLHLIAFPLMCLAGGAAHAQDTTSSDVMRQLLPIGDDLDPLGVGDLGALESVTLWSPDDVVPAVDEGDVLAAIPGVRELDHRLDISLHEGFATIDVVQRFVHRGRHPAELAYQMRMPAGASLRSLEVCVQDRCRTGGVTADQYETLFAAEGDRMVEAHAQLNLENDLLRLRVAPITRDGTVELRWSYRVAASAHGGVLRVDLPARGHDLRIAPAVVVVHQGEYGRAQLNGRSLEADDGRVGYRATERSVESWQPIQVSARIPVGPPRTIRTSYPCQAEGAPAVCEHTYREARLRSAGPLEVTLLLDVSPSTLGPARGRMTEIVAALVSTLPPSSHLRAAAFAGRTEALVPDRTSARQIPADLVARAFGLELGAATQLESAIRQFRFRPRDHIIILGDGGISRRPGAVLSLPPGVRVSYIQLADRPVSPELRTLVEESGGELLFVAERPEPTRALEPLSRLYAPHALRQLAAGENEHGDRVLHVGLAARRFLRRFRRRQNRQNRQNQAHDASIAALAGQMHLGTVVLDNEREVLGVVRTGEVFQVVPEVVPAGRSLSREPVLNMLRSRLIPAARLCFRQDRHGREQYSVHATYELVFADREVERVEVQGEVPPELRTCLIEAADQLVVPAFDSVVRVRYPLHTASYEPSAAIALDPRVMEEIDRAGFDEEDPRMPPSLH